MNIRILTLIVLFLLGSQTLAQSGFILNEDSFYFGATPSESVISRTFYCRSISDDTIRVSSIRTGCGCMIAEPTQFDLLPGDSTAVRIFWDTRNSSGLETRPAYIFTEDSNKPLRIDFSAVCGSPEELDRQLVSLPLKPVFLKKPKSTADIKKSITIRNLTEENIKLSLINTPDKFNIVVPDSLGAAKADRIRISLKSSEWSEYLSDSFTILISVDDNEIQTVTIPLTCSLVKRGSLLTKAKK